METAVFTCAVIIIFCVIASKFSNKIGVPTLLLFIILGMLFGSDGILKISFSDYELAEQICSAALIFIMFYGGFGTNWKMAKPVAVKSFILASAGVVVTAALTGVFCYFVLGLTFLESMLLGGVVSSTDAASVFAILRSKNLNLKGGLASLLELESGSNDPASYMLTVIILGIMSGGGGQSIPYMVFAQVVFGLVVGAVVAKMTLVLFERYDFSDNSLDMLYVVAIALLSYSLAGLIGGNGYLSVYICGIILGNSKINNKVALVHFFDGITGLMQILLFFLLGLLVTPSLLPVYILPALAIFAFLTLIGRPLSVSLFMIPFKMPFKQQLLVSWAGLRGAASIVFAIMVTVSDAYTEMGVFHIVFCIALLSVMIQGTLLPGVAHKLDLVDDDESVMQTFNDYIDDTNVELVKEYVSRWHDWVGKRIEEIHLPPNSLVIMIERGKDTIIPNGRTKIKERDTLVFSCEKYTKDASFALTELQIEESHPWEDQYLKDIEMQKGSLILMIKRDGETIVPKGETLIKRGDTLVMNGN